MSRKHLPDGIRVRWLGHATFDLIGPAGQKFLIDPFLVNNPAFPQALGAEVTAPGAAFAPERPGPEGDCAI
jgi:L-ascorbate metabolism protein UlaG (beta-lactamase superfamily)